MAAPKVGIDPQLRHEYTVGLLLRRPKLQDKSRGIHILYRAGNYHGARLTSGHGLMD